MTNELILISFLALAGLIAAIVIRARYRHEFIVTDGFAGLLYHEGKLVETLAAGRHVRWGKNYRVALVDTRKTLLQVAGQEVLSADNVGVKLSIVLTTQIVDAAKSVQAADNHAAHIYSTTQTAVRTVVAGVTMEALLTQRVAIGAQLRELIAPQAEAVGVQVHAVEVRDVMLPGELRRRSAKCSRPSRKVRPRSNAPAVNPPRCATSPTRRASSRASRHSRRSASCKRSKRPTQVRRS